MDAVEREMLLRNKRTCCRLLSIVSDGSGHSVGLILRNKTTGEKTYGARSGELA